jgi:heme exporter protein CcmD
MLDWLAMDGYAGFVWGSWALGAGVLGALIALALRARARALAHLARLEAELEAAGDAR